MFHFDTGPSAVKFEYNECEYLFWRTGKLLEVVFQHFLIVNMNESQKILMNNARLKTSIQQRYTICTVNIKTIHCGICGNCVAAIIENSRIRFNLVQCFVQTKYLTLCSMSRNLCRNKIATEVETQVACIV